LNPVKTEPDTEESEAAIERKVEVRIVVVLLYIFVLLGYNFVFSSRSWQKLLDFPSE